MQERDKRVEALAVLSGATYDDMKEYAEHADAVKKMIIESYGETLYAITQLLSLTIMARMLFTSKETHPDPDLLQFAMAKYLHTHLDDESLQVLASDDEQDDEELKEVVNICGGMISPREVAKELLIEAMELTQARYTEIKF